MISKVLVVMVTYNRKNLLKNALESIFNQTKPVSGILILDNASNDGTEDVLQKFGFLSRAQDINDGTLIKRSSGNTRLYYYRNSVNTGGAGGFSRAVELAKELDYDYLWIMDDDVRPVENCLENLLAVVHDCNVGAVVPNRNCQNFEDHPTVELDLNSTFKYFMKK